MSEKALDQQQQRVMLTATNIAYCLVRLIFGSSLISLRLSARHTSVPSVRLEGHRRGLSFPRLQREFSYALPLLLGERNVQIY
jgi:hypothetical protein